MTEILLYGTIGDALDGLEAKTIVPLIKAAQGDLTVRINSPGGFVFEGLAIYEALASYSGGAVTVEIDGIAASMASIIAMAGRQIVMAESALMMIHKPWNCACGDAEELRSSGAQLDKIEGQMIGIYARRTGLAAGQLSKMLERETWFTASEAKAQGFCTTISKPLQIAAMADISACGFRNIPTHLEGTIMTGAAQAVVAERERITQISALCEKHKLGHMTAALIDKAVPLDRARALILEELAARGDELGIGHSAPAVVGSGTLGDPEFHAKAVGDAIYARMSGKAPEGAAREFMGLRLIDMARDMLSVQGNRNVARMGAHEVFSQASWNNGRSSQAARDRASWLQTSRGYGGGGTTFDFPELLQGAGERFLLDIFQAAGSPIKKVSRKRSASDFRQIYGISLSGFGQLDQLLETAEYKYRLPRERAETYKLKTFGNIFPLSRQAIINDDLGSFSDPLRIMARSAAETEAVILADILATNPQMSDGNALFSNAHGNLAGIGAAPSLDTFSAGRRSMRDQLDEDGVTPLNLPPKFILSGSAQETLIESLIATITPATTDDVNVFSGKFNQLVDPRLAGNAWYFFADPAIGPVLEHAYLDGVEGPHLETEEGWRVDGTEFKVRMDFGAGIVGWHGAYKNPGQ